MVEKIFNITKGLPVLHLPVLHSLEKWYIKVVDMETGKQYGEFYIGLNSKEMSHYYPMYLYDLEGKQVKLSCDDEDVPEDLFDGIIQGNIIEDHPTLYPGIYKEKERPQVHYSARRGWLNDPNGLFYDGENFHLYHQHNPFGPTHGSVNMSWGHAVSKDCVHFKEYHDGIRPNTSITHIASGSAILDTYNISGMGEGTVLATYTAHGTLQFKNRNPRVIWSQILCYSTDGGYSFKSFENPSIIEVPEGDVWRDPKILFMDDGTLCIAVYETYEGHNCVSFYSSKDCRNWKFESRTMDLYECPDLFRITVPETGEKLWVLYGGNGMYRVGMFEDYKFTQIGDCIPMDFGTSVYAGQTWNSYPSEDMRYHIAWINEGWWGEKDPYPTTGFTQSMSLACELTLHKMDDGYRLFRKPTEAFGKLKIGDGQKIESACDKAAFDLPMPAETDIVIDTEDQCQVTVCGAGFTYSPADRMLYFTSGKQFRLHGIGALSCRIVTDVRSVEFFIDDEISATYFIYEDGATTKKLNISGKDVKVSGKIFDLESIWN